MTKKISSAQMRAARALLRWSALDLAKASKVGVATIRRVEVVDGEIPVTLANEAALRQALEAAGVEFTNGDQLGVRLTRTAAARSAEATAASKPSAAAKAVRGRTANAPRKKR
jgi:hypothetical protein